MLIIYVLYLDSFWETLRASVSSFQKVGRFYRPAFENDHFSTSFTQCKTFFFRKTVIDGSRAHQNVKLWVPSTALKNSTFFENKWEKRSIAIIFAKRFFHFLKCLWGQWFLQKPTIKSWPSRPRKNRKTKSWLWN